MRAKIVDTRVPAHIEVTGLIRAVQAAGGFAAVLARGEPDAGTILVVCCERGANAAAYERMPGPTKSRRWTLNRRQEAEKEGEFSDYLNRRSSQDSDLWIVELDIADAERFIDSAGTTN